MAIKLTKEDAAQLKAGLRKAFDVADDDRSGQIDVREFERVLRLYNSSSECVQKIDEDQIKQISAEFIKLADKNADGKVSFNEFQAFMFEALGVQE